MEEQKPPEENDEMIKIIEKNRYINMKNMLDEFSFLISNESKWSTYYITDMSFMLNGLFII